MGEWNTSYKLASNLLWNDLAAEWRFVNECCYPQPLSSSFPDTRRDTVPACAVYKKTGFTGQSNLQYLGQHSASWFGNPHWTPSPAQLMMPSAEPHWPRMFPVSWTWDSSSSFTSEAVRETATHLLPARKNSESKHCTLY